MLTAFVAALPFTIVAWTPCSPVAMSIQTPLSSSDEGAVMVTDTFAVLPFAFFGTRNDTFATPPWNEVVWVIALPATVALPTIFPAVSGAVDCPSWVDETGNETVRRLPAVGRAGTSTGLPIVGVTNSVSVFDGPAMLYIHC